ncbi:MAG: SIS domain-containing protein [Candidatus Tritonobacter lacicola]|nr:SIS domain-containing protein [Candidatus Tritonobacter lacicola]
MNIGEYADGYLKGLSGAIEQITVEGLRKITDILQEAYGRGRTIFIIGNGGSAATASHFACDLGKGTACEGKPRFRVESLADNNSLVTALANDCGYERVFVEQLKGRSREGDVLIAISVSGNSPNVLEAVRYAGSSGLVTIGLVGKDGGSLAGMVDEKIVIGNDHFGIVEDCHLIIEHIVSFFFKQKIASSP